MESKSRRADKLRSMVDKMQIESDMTHLESTIKTLDTYLEEVASQGFQKAAGIINFSDETELNIGDDVVVIFAGEIFHQERFIKELIDEYNGDGFSSYGFNKIKNGCQFNFDWS